MRHKPYTRGIDKGGGHLAISEKRDEWLIACEDVILRPRVRSQKPYFVGDDGGLLRDRSLKGLRASCDDE